MTKKAITTAALCLGMATATATASNVQPLQPDTITLKSHTLVVDETASDVSVEVYNREGEALSKTFEGRYTDEQTSERVYITSPFLPKRSGFRSYNSQHPSFWFGYSMPTDGAFTFSKVPGLHQQNSRSWEWGIVFATVDKPLSRRNDVGLNVSLAISNTHLHFQDDYYLTRLGDGQAVMVQSEERLRKSYLSYWTLNIPFAVEKQWRVGGHRLAIGAGPMLSLNFGDHARYKKGGRKHTETSDINMNTLGLGFEAYLSYAGVSLYWRKSVTPLMDKHAAPTCYPMTVAIGL